MRCAADDRSHVVIAINPVNDVGGEEAGENLRRLFGRPALPFVVLGGMETGTGDDMDSALAADLCQPDRVAPGGGRHGINDCSDPGLGARREFPNGLIHARQQDVGPAVHDQLRVDDQMLMNERETKVGRVDVAEHGADQGCHVDGTSRIARSVRKRP